MTRHKARLRAELTKARLRRGFASIEELRQHVNLLGNNVLDPQEPTATRTVNTQIGGSPLWSRPRWVRINTLRTSLDAELRTTFVNYARVDTIEQILKESSEKDVYYVDEHIPNLLALPLDNDIQKSAAFTNGLVILQDKASCFPAYILDPRPQEGDIVDACAAPGNKTTHLAALLQSRISDQTRCRIWACERDRARALTLKSMVEKTGAHEIVRVKSGQDFLQVNPQESPWNGVFSLLLDPSCSGSGIVGRDDVSVISLPTKMVGGQQQGQRSKKRKRSLKSEQKSTTNTHQNEVLMKDNIEDIRTRLLALSAFQLRLLQHAFSFPSARKIIYSTCSLHVIENEVVVLKALTSSVSRQRGWRILKREEQVIGARAWPLRGDSDACLDVALDDNGCVDLGDNERAVVAEACIRCEKGTQEGTQGFFVAGFVRDECPSGENGAHLGKMGGTGTTEAEPRAEVEPMKEESGNVIDLEWEGFEEE